MDRPPIGTAFPPGRGGLPRHGGKGELPAHHDFPGIHEVVHDPQIHHRDAVPLGDVGKGFSRRHPMMPWTGHGHGVGARIWQGGDDGGQPLRRLARHVEPGALGQEMARGIGFGHQGRVEVPHPLERQIRPLGQIRKFDRHRKGQGYDVQGRFLFHWPQGGDRMPEHPQRGHEFGVKIAGSEVEPGILVGDDDIPQIRGARFPDRRDHALESRVIGRDGQGPGAEHAVIVGQMAGRRLGGKRRVPPLVQQGRHLESLTIRRAAHELPESGGTHRRAGERIEGRLDEGETPQFRGNALAFQCGRKDVFVPARADDSLADAVGLSGLEPHPRGGHPMGKTRRLGPGLEQIPDPALFVAHFLRRIPQPLHVGQCLLVHRTELLHLLPRHGARLSQVHHLVHHSEIPVVVDQDLLTGVLREHLQPKRFLLGHDAGEGKIGVGIGAHGKRRNGFHENGGGDVRGSQGRGKREQEDQQRRDQENRANSAREPNKGPVRGGTGRWWRRRRWIHGMSSFSISDFSTETTPRGRRTKRSSRSRRKCPPVGFHRKCPGVARPYQKPAGRGKSFSILPDYCFPRPGGVIWPSGTRRSGDSRFFRFQGTGRTHSSGAIRRR